MKPLIQDQLVGQIVSGCRVEQLLSHGRLSALYRAYHMELNRSVAVTLLLLSQVLPSQEHERVRMRFLRQAPRLVEVRHPYLLPMYGYGVWEGFPYLITAYRTEESLASLLAQQGTSTPEATLLLLEQVTVGLEYAHQNGLVHGMLTPAHLLLSQGQSLQIAGLGLLHLLESCGLLPLTEVHSSPFTLIGTPSVTTKYLAPECLQGHTATIRSDVYSLGVILLELLNGLLPMQEADPLERIVPGGGEPESYLERHVDMLPPALKQVMRCTLAEDPRSRFQRVSDLLAAWAAGVEEQAAQKVSNDRADTLFPVSPLSVVETSSPEVGNEVQETEMQTSDAFVDQWSLTGSPSKELPSYSSAGSTRDHTSVPHKGRISRRRVTAVLAGSLAVGMLGVSSIKIASLMKPGLPGQSSAASSVIGHTSQALNTAQAFNQPGETEHRQRLLIHLPSGAFVAYKQGCTHSGVLVNYDSQRHLLVCPAHGAIFDPAQGGRVLHGPATRPLPQVTIHVNSDGTITTK
jgi:serine/threonine protein kinase